MTSVMQLTMTNEMRNTISRANRKPPISHEDILKYAQATLTNIVTNHMQEFNHFFNKPEDMIAFLKWMDKKERGEFFTEREMTGLRVLNSCQIKYLSIAIFKEMALHIFDKEQFCQDLGLPTNYKSRAAYNYDDHDIPDLEEIDSDSDDDEDDDVPELKEIDSDSDDE